MDLWHLLNYLLNDHEIISLLPDIGTSFPRMPNVTVVSYNA